MDTLFSPTQQNTSVVAFQLDGRTFALPLDAIVQLLPMMTITPIPQMNKIVKGTINVRGEDILVVNLRCHLGIEEIPPQLYTPLLLLKSHNRSLALIVDSVLDVMALPLEKMTSLQNILPEGIEGIPMLHGVSRHNDETVLVLDPDHLFDSHHHTVEAEIRAREAAPAIVKKEVAPVIKDEPVAKDEPVVKDEPVAKDEPIAQDALVAKDEPIAVKEAPVAKDTPTKKLKKGAVPAAAPESTPTEKSE